MFTEAERSRWLQRLIELARADESITAAALVGSHAAGTADAYSDIDLALATSESVAAAATRWTVAVTDLDQISDTLDLRAGSALYRVFLLDSSLQIDLSFWPAADFASTGEPFELIFGSTGDQRPAVGPDPYAAVGWAWLYALHVRSALARGRHHQATEMLVGMRSQLIALACARHGLPTHHGRGVDQLPAADRAGLDSSWPTDCAVPALAAAFTAALDWLGEEAELVDSDLARRLQAPLAVLRAQAGAAGAVVGPITA